VQKSDKPVIVVVRPDALVRTGRPVALSDLKDARVTLGLQLWNELRAGCKYPTRETIRPRLFSKVLGNMTLARRLDDGNDYEFRVVGDAFEVANGFSWQGKRTRDIDEVSPGYGTALKRVFD